MIKIILAAIFIFGVSFCVAWSFGVLDVDANVSVSDGFKKDTVEITSDVLESTQEHTDNTFDKLHKTLKELK